MTFDYFPKKRGLYSLLMSGDAPLTLARLAVTRLLREDVSETMRSLVHGGEWRLWLGPQSFE